MLISTFFSEATRVIEEWLDGQDASQVTRDMASGNTKRPRSWTLHLNEPVLRGSPVRLILPRDFPASVPRIEVDSSLCLVLPHVEETGRICLGVDPSPADFDDPVEVVCEVIRRFEKLVQNWQDPNWVAQEFQEERLSYWLRFCDRYVKDGHSTNKAKFAYLSVPEFDLFEEGQVAYYPNKNTVVLAGGQDANVLARRHNLGAGTLVRGHTLFVRLRNDELWTPACWPMSFLHLDNLIRGTSAEEVSLVDWIKSHQNKKSPKAFYVVLVQGHIPYAYRIVPAFAPHLTYPGIEPLWCTRIDPSWALTRDQAPATFSGRQSKRVLLLGCGSMGSAVAELLARSGIGKLDLVDNQTFLPENVSRHTLGLRQIGSYKAVSLAAELQQKIPGLEVSGYPANVVPWLVEKAQKGAYDLVVDCTGESSIRGFLSLYRHKVLGEMPIIHSWMEPFGAASHVILLHARDCWPLSDPVDTHVNAASWGSAARIRLPACGDGFHPYGVADAWQAAGFVTERALQALEISDSPSMVYSWVRSRQYFAEHGAENSINAWVPEDEANCWARMLTRDFSTVMASNE